MTFLYFGNGIGKANRFADLHEDEAGVHDGAVATPEENDKNVK